MSIGLRDAANLDMQQQDALIEAEKLMISDFYSSQRSLLAGSD
tara:strand:- start:174 stop:302 length:129 start_codon:yes stop_codon:yes gene_type:complete